MDTVLPALLNTSKDVKSQFMNKKNKIISNGLQVNIIVNINNRKGQEVFFNTL